jgi:hypothetical protein
VFDFWFVYDPEIHPHLPLERDRNGTYLNILAAPAGAMYGR